jgi:hypothetical protein
MVFVLPVKYLISSSEHLGDGTVLLVEDGEVNDVSVIKNLGVYVDPISLL